MRTTFQVAILAAFILLVASIANAAPYILGKYFKFNNLRDIWTIIPADRHVEAEVDAEDDGVGWFVASPALMRPAYDGYDIDR